MRGRSARLLIGISVLWIPLAFLFDGVTVLVLPIRLGGDATPLGIVSLVGLGIAALLQPVAGWLSDRYRSRIDRRWFLVIAALPALVGVWILAGTTGFAAALLGYVVLQLGGTALQAGQQTLIPEHVDQREQGRASGLKAAFDVGGSFLAFAVLGMILASGNVVPSAVLISVLVVGTVSAVFALVPRSANIGRAARWSFAVPRGLVPVTVSRFLFLFGTYAVGRFLVLLVAERLGVPPDDAVGDAGWLLAALTLTTALAALPSGWVADRRSRRDLMVAGAIVTAVGVLLLVPSAGLLGVAIGGLVMSFGTAAFITGNWAATTALVPGRDAGRLMGMANLGTGLAAAAAGGLGPLIDASGFAPALLVAAASCLAAIVPQLRVTTEPAFASEKLA